MHWRVQRRAARWISNKHDQTTSVTGLLLHQLHLKSLEACRQLSRMTFLYKILNEHVAMAVLMNHLCDSLTDLPEDLLPKRDSRYLAVPQLSLKSLLLQELLLNGIHYQTPSPHWLRYHPSENSVLLYCACTHAHFIAAISTRSLAIITEIQIQTGDENVSSMLNAWLQDQEQLFFLPQISCFREMWDQVRISCRDHGEKWQNVVYVCCG